MKRLIIGVTALKNKFQKLAEKMFGSRTGEIILAILFSFLGSIAFILFLRYVVCNILTNV